LLYAPDYGVPQKESRLILFGIRDEDLIFWSHSKKNHGPETAKAICYHKRCDRDLPSLKPKDNKREI